MTHLIGRQFGNYRLTRLLGQGGFAEVYLGQHVHLSSQQAALKILSTRLTGQDTTAFVREAETIAALIHPHIVRVLDFDIQEQCPFLVMDYAPHGSLRQRHRRGEQVPLPLVVSYAQQIAQGLAYAHEKRIIHRDVKPDNMLIDAQNKIVISDFGIATIVHNTSSQIAQEIYGTVPYMAPEQLQGKIHPASDQYSLAITLYEWLMGAHPFTGTFTEIAIKHATAIPAPLHEKCPMLPPLVEQVIFKALAKDPKDRFINIMTFVNALTQASQPVSATQTAQGFPVAYPTYPTRLSSHAFTATHTHQNQSVPETYLPPSTEAHFQPLRPYSPSSNEHQKGRKGPITTLVLVLILVFILILGRNSIFAALKTVAGHSSQPAITATSAPTVVPTATPVPHLTSVADFTSQAPQLSNLTLVRNDSLFQNDHSILTSNGQMVIAFPTQTGAKTVTLVIRALVSQQAPNQSGFSPINLLCNSQIIVSDYIMPGNGYDPNTTSIQVPMQELANGTNQIELQVTTNAQTNFWLYKLEVQQSA